jgi:hypothetical protein
MRGWNSIAANAGATRRGFVTLAAIAALLMSATAQAQEKSIVVASTTSTRDSGLFGHILPLFKNKTGIDVRVISQGTGQALDTGRHGAALWGVIQRDYAIEDAGGIEMLAQACACAELDAAEDYASHIAKDRRRYPSKWRAERSSADQARAGGTLIRCPHAAAAWARR